MRAEQASEKAIGSETVGAGLTLVSTFGPTLGIDLPYGARLAGFLVGLILMLWPLSLLLKNRKQKIIYFYALAVFVLIIGAGVVKFHPLEAVAAPVSGAPQTGSASGNGGIGVNNGTQYNTFNPPTSASPSPSPGIENEDSQIGEQEGKGPGAIKNVRSKVGKQKSDTSPIPKQTSKNKHAELGAAPRTDAYGNPCRIIYDNLNVSDNWVSIDGQLQAPQDLPPGVCVGNETVKGNRGLTLRQNGSRVNKQESEDNKPLNVPMTVPKIP